MTALAAHYTPEHTMFRETCRRFFEKEVTPFHMKWEEEGVVPRELWRKAGQQGLLGMAMPEAYGGAGGDFLYSAILIEEQGRAIASGPAFSLHNDIVVPYLLHYANEEQKKKYLTPLAKGELLGAYCLTEPNAGSNAANQQTTAVLDGDHWVLNGSKIFITNAGPADVFITYAATDKALGPKGISAFIVPADTPGVRKGKKEHKLGIHASDTREIHYENARIPKDLLLGELNKGYGIALATLGGGRIGIAAQALGIAQASVEAAVQYANEREQFDKKIGEFDAVRTMLADSGVELETSRLLVYQAAWLRDMGRPNTKEASLAKWHASEAATKCANLAIQVHGGYGYMSEYHVERYWRDARICEIYEGTTEVQKMVVAGQVLKENAIG